MIEEDELIDLMAERLNWELELHQDIWVDPQFLRDHARALLDIVREWHAAKRLREGGGA